MISPATGAIILNSLVTVYPNLRHTRTHGTGFRLGNYIITAAHIVTSVFEPGDAPWGDDEFVVKIGRRGVGKSVQPHAMADVLFCDLRSDLAILSGTSREFEDIINDASSLSVAEVAVNQKIDAFVYSSKNKWVSGSAWYCCLSRPVLLLYSEGVPPGTSGSPLVDAQGRVVGVISAESPMQGQKQDFKGLASYLWGALPSWIDTKRDSE